MLPVTYIIVGPRSEKSIVTGKTQVFIKPVGDSSTDLQRQMQML